MKKIIKPLIILSAVGLLAACNAKETVKLYDVNYNVFCGRAVSIVKTIGEIYETPLSHLGVEKITIETTMNDWAKNGKKKVYNYDGKEKLSLDLENNFLQIEDKITHFEDGETLEYWHTSTAMLDDEGNLITISESNEGSFYRIYRSKETIEYLVETMAGVTKEDVIDNALELLALETGDYFEISPLSECEYSDEGSYASWITGFDVAYIESSYKLDESKTVVDLNVNDFEAKTHGSFGLDGKVTCRYHAEYDELVISSVENYYSEEGMYNNFDGKIDDYSYEYTLKKTSEVGSAQMKKPDLSKSVFLGSME